MQAVYLLLGGLALASAAQPTSNVAPVPVAVYYESLCPDSIKFVTKQLYPTYKKLGKHIDLTLIPYGKSTYLRSENGTILFDCHHGKNECYGNKVQACALKHLADFNDKVEFVNCVMDKVKPKSDDAYPGQKCAEKLELSYDKIKSCVNTSEGDELLAKMGDMTNALSPKLSSVPTIVFNSSYDKKADDEAEANFLSALCARISGSKELKECKNSAGSTQAAIFLTLAAAILSKILS